MTRHHLPSQSSISVFLTVTLVVVVGGFWQVGHRWQEEARFWLDQLTVSQDAELQFLREKEEMQRRLTAMEGRVTELEAETRELRQQIELNASDDDAPP